MFTGLPHFWQNFVLRRHRRSDAAAATKPASLRDISGPTDLASFVDVAVSSVPHLIRPVTAGFLATASRTRDSQVPWTSAQNTGAPSSSLNPRKDSLSNASGSSSVPSSSAGASSSTAGAFTSFSLASAGANRTPGRESSGSTSTTSARPDTKGRRMARGSSAAARTASVSARSSDARSASERAEGR